RIGRPTGELAIGQNELGGSAILAGLSNVQDEATRSYRLGSWIVAAALRVASVYSVGADRHLFARRRDEPRQRVARVARDADHAARKFRVGDEQRSQHRNPRQIVVIDVELADVQESLLVARAPNGATRAIDVEQRAEGRVDQGVGQLPQEPR